MSELDKFDFNKLNSIFEKITNIESLEVFSKMLQLTDVNSEIRSEFFNKIEVKRQEIKQEISSKKISDEIDKHLKDNKFKSNKDIFKDIIENLVKEYHSKNYNMTELKARLKKYFEIA